ncbi:hypothetical protein E2C01_075619 [Portunus trituberculatus]|uniref:Uncharacterized protein n=1 Tax=Portunus trituberculatus TaxID=210409 RepID=A0A5B7IGL0_PORTR|nr:hypothetical protein [Portunus trituberculatus]
MPVVAAVVFYSSVVVPALTGYFSFPKLLLRLTRSLCAVFVRPSLSTPCHAFSYLSVLYLLLLLCVPLVLYHLRPHPALLMPTAICYLMVVLPRALGPQLPQASPLWLPRTLATLLLTR